jgi:Phage integrase, N-terminal SAM-like domain
MLDLALPRLSRAARAWFIGSPLECSADPYVQYLLDRGYAAATIRSYLMSVAHLAHWCGVHRYGLGDLNEALLDRFVRRHLSRCRCADRVPHLTYCVRPALLHLLRMLRAEERIASGTPDDPPAIVAELREFDRYLIDVRGLAQTTRYSRVIRVRAFLLDLFADRRIQLETLHRADIVGFMARSTAKWKPPSKQRMVSSLQSYFRFKAISDVATTALSAALPTIAHWRLATLPKGLWATELSRLLGAFDRTCATGRRDYAITRCFADLGLGTAEIARLRLDDVDWQQGTLRIRGKGRRVGIYYPCLQ